MLSNLRDSAQSWQLNATGEWARVLVADDKVRV
jgi:hypothetical protein